MHSAARRALTRLTTTTTTQSLNRLSTLHNHNLARQSYPIFNSPPSDVRSFSQSHNGACTLETNAHHASSNASSETKGTPGDVSAWAASLNVPLSEYSPNANPFKLALGELDKLTEALLSTVRVLQLPVLDAAAAHLLSLQGKRIRPTIVILIANAAAAGAISGAPVPNLLPSQRRLAEITELIHAASLLHDDVIDDAATRRGAPSANAAFGNQLAVLAGDFLLARASVALARLRDCDVVELLSTVIEHLVRGEVLQMRSTSDNNNSLIRNIILPAATTIPISGGLGEASRSVDYDKPTTAFETYLAKTFFKTASLIANSSRAVCMLGGTSAPVADAAFRYGEHVGIAFQLIDDVLDMTASAEELGKPVCNDLRQGHATAPVLYAMQDFPGALDEMAARKFAGEGDVERTMELVWRADGIERTRQLAASHAAIAVRALMDNMNASPHRSALINLAHMALVRER